LRRDADRLVEINIRHCQQYSLPQHWTIVRNLNTRFVRFSDLNTFDGYAQRYLREWDKRATVRTQPRLRLPDRIMPQDIFPAGMQPIAKHPAVVALGERAVLEVLVRSLYKFLGEIANLEIDIVGQLCGELANGAFDFPLPASARQVARTIGVDEYYHAYAAREQIAELAERTGIDPGPSTRGSYALATAIASLQRDADPAFCGEAEIMALCFTENFVTEELFGLSKKAEPNTIFHVILREHLIDEGRHQVFFQMLMRHMWQHIGEPCRLALGRLLPGFLDAFLLDRESMRASDLRILGLLGFDRERGTQIAQEAFLAEYGDRQVPKSRLFAAKRLFNLAKVAGIDAHEPTRAALVQAGWLDEQTAPA
jgi:hypothetical protein